jgi:uncharacterized protein (PEP-CTERM system associated)
MPEQGSRLLAIVSALACAGLAASSGAAHAQLAGGLPGSTSGDLLNGSATGWRIAPSLDTSLRWSDNVLLSADNKVSDLEFRLTPGLSIAGRSGSVTGSLQLAWENSFYAREKSLSHDQLLGSGFGTADLYERRLLLDGSMSMSRERSSIFGAPPSSGLYQPSSQTMLRTYSLSPYYLIQTAGGLSGEARYRYTYTDSSGDILSNNTRHDATFSLGSGAPMPFGWSTSAYYSYTSYKQAEDQHIGSIRVTGTYAFDPLFRVLAIVGYERNNFVSTVGQSQDIYGGGFEWNPSPRTRLYAEGEKRFFGNGYDIELSWRSPLSGITGRMTRDVSTTSSTLDSNSLINLYLAYLTSVPKDVTDPLQRLLLAEQAWKAHGLPNTIGQGTTYVSQAYFLEQRADLGGMWNGVRNSLSLIAYQSKRSRLADPATLAPGDDLAMFDKTEEIGGNITATHAVSPRTNMMMGFGASRSRGEGGVITAQEETRRRNASLSASTTLGPHTTGGVIYQYNASRGASEYDENSIIANVGMRF